jgi:hypothetical protein
MLGGLGQMIPLTLSWTVASCFSAQGDEPSDACFMIGSWSGLVCSMWNNFVGSRRCDELSPSVGDYFDSWLLIMCCDLEKED